jgi:uncharacterized protein YrrD
MTLRFSDAVGTPVYSKATADQLGRVIRWVVDASTHRIGAVQVAGRKDRALLAGWSDVVGFGPDAVVVSEEERLRHPDGEYEQRVTGGQLELRGRRVLTDRGLEVGALVDVEFDERSGAITEIATDHARVSGDGLRVIGPYAVIVRHDAVDVAEGEHDPLDDRPGEPTS